jgi:indole-3-glycerol phosphate synthase
LAVERAFVQTILDRILAVKRREMAALAPRRDALRSAARSAPPPRDFAAALRRPPGGPVGVIAECKHRSPSAGTIIEPYDPAAIARRYAAGGADAVSCLTDAEFFGGSLNHLAAVRAAVDLPVLRKDFIIAPEQIWEARAAGADAVLLIAEALDPAAMADLAALAADLGMAVLAEAHSEAMADRAVACGAPLVGVNNRDLATFAVSLETTVRLAPRILAAGRVLVAESGIRTAADVSHLLAAGAHAVLVGEGLLRSGDVEARLAQFKAAR